MFYQVLTLFILKILLQRFCSFCCFFKEILSSFRNFFVKFLEMVNLNVQKKIMSYAAFIAFHDLSSCFGYTKNCPYGDNLSFNQVCYQDKYTCNHLFIVLLNNCSCFYRDEIAAFWFLFEMTKCSTYLLSTSDHKRYLETIVVNSFYIEQVSGL